jgi:probable F420-dependent oxidoreductase
VQFGVHLPHFGPSVSRDGLRRFARRADALDFHSVWASDHIAWPEHIDSPYPYTATGVWPAHDPWMPRLDAIGTLLFVAGCTERVRLGTTVLVLGYRPPVQTAKLWVTLDVVSGGRAILGVGVGWMREEFEVLGMPADHRGARADEQLEIFERLFADHAPAHDGRYYRFPPLGFEPKPLRGRIPVWVGGDAPAALRRAGRTGDALHAAHVSPETLGAQWTEVRRHCAEAGRDPAAMELSVRLGLDYAGASARPHALSGGPEAVLERIAAYAAVGTTHLLLDITGDSVDGLIHDMERFAEEILPAVPG